MEISILLPKLTEYIKWNKARINFLANFLIALLKVKTVNLAEIATGFGGKAKIESNYRRIQRFFNSFDIDFRLIAQLIVSMLGIRDTAWTLIIDRTNWKFGKLNINILMLGIGYKGIAFPILWSLLPKKGNSTYQERCDLLNLFMEIFPHAKVEYLLADREFIGIAWFSYLLQAIRPISFRIRIRKNTLVANSRGVVVSAEFLFSHLKQGQYEILEGRRYAMGKFLFVIGLCLQDGLLILVTDRNPELALQDYLDR